MKTSVLALGLLLSAAAIWADDAPNLKDPHVKFQQGQTGQGGVAGTPIGSQFDITKPIPLRSDIVKYLAHNGQKYDVYHVASAHGAADNADKLAMDMQLAIAAYVSNHGSVSFKDKQDFTSKDFYMAQGEARFNPNRDQTSALKAVLNDKFKTGYLVQADVIYFALEATKGNVTLAMGSLAELYCWNRGEYIQKTADMENAEGKNYYRYAGAFIGFHGGGTAAMGEAAAYANIVGNPIVYAGGELVASWVSYFKGEGLKPVDTLKTLGPDGHGDLINKVPQLKVGEDAAAKVKSSSAWSDQ